MDALGKLSFSESSHQSAKEINKNVMDKIIEKLNYKKSPIYNLIQSWEVTIGWDSYIAIISPVGYDVWGRMKLSTIVTYIKKFYSGSLYIDENFYRV